MTVMFQVVDANRGKTLAFYSSEKAAERHISKVQGTYPGDYTGLECVPVWVQHSVRTDDVGVLLSDNTDPYQDGDRKNG